MRLIFATCSSDEAESLARTLLEEMPNAYLSPELGKERLVGCANLIPGVTSLYWWDEELTLDEEVVMFMETTAEQVDEATERLRELHPYDVPKIVVIDPEDADPDYMAWLRDATQPPEDEEEGGSMASG